VTLDQFETFLLWCWVLNSGFYALTVVGLLGMRKVVNRIHTRLFGVTAEDSNRLLIYYLGAYKIVITAFMFVPWLVLVIFF
jgi:hypothetical protein